jgi:hypothetical protein
MPVSQYRSRPIIIEAIQWDGNNTEQVMVFTDNHCGELANGSELLVCSKYHADIGDYIVTDALGKCFVVKEDIFDQLYEEV